MRKKHNFLVLSQIKPRNHWRLTGTDFISILPPYLNLGKLDEFIDSSLSEDLGSGDVTTEWTIPAGRSARGVFVAKEEGIVAGLVVSSRIFDRIDPELITEWNVQDGDRVAPGQRFGTISGNARAILIGERFALNVMQRMSGIATSTAAYVRETSGSRAKILDTRKTLPGLRLFDKWAVVLGGGMNHRIGLHDMVLIKDNHIAAAGGIMSVIESVNHYRLHTGNAGIPVEIEAATLEQVREIITCGGVDRILLDNMVDVRDDGSVDTSMLSNAVEMIDGRFETEASGNVRLETVSDIAATGVDFISCGALTHSVQALDLSLQIQFKR